MPIVYGYVILLEDCISSRTVMFWSLIVPKCLAQCLSCKRHPAHIGRLTTKVGGNSQQFTILDANTIDRDNFISCFSSFSGVFLGLCGLFPELLQSPQSSDEESHTGAPGRADCNPVCHPEGVPSSAVSGVSSAPGRPPWPPLCLPAKELPSVLRFLW